MQARTSQSLIMDEDTKLRSEVKQDELHWVRAGEGDCLETSLHFDDRAIFGGMKRREIRAQERGCQ